MQEGFGRGEDLKSPEDVTPAWSKKKRRKKQKGRPTAGRAVCPGKNGGDERGAFAGKGGRPCLPDRGTDFITLPGAPRGGGEKKKKLFSFAIVKEREKEFVSGGGVFFFWAEPGRKGRRGRCQELMERERKRKQKKGQGRWRQ